MSQTATLPTLTAGDVDPRPVAALLHRGPDDRGTLAPLRLRRLGPGDVRVAVEAVGVCHSDLSLSNGTLPQRWPAVLGHEASGRVVEAGPEAAGVRPGDRVILLWNPTCGSCWACRAGDAHLCRASAADAVRPWALTADGETVYAGLGVGGFAEETVVDASRVVPVEGLEPEQAAMLGCAGLTGVGAVVNTGALREGETVAVVGLGGVGLSAVQGAVLGGAAAVVAVDPSGERREQARALGAEPAAPGDAAKELIAELTGGRGVDLAVDCVGSSQTIRSSWQSTRRGGRCVVVGIGRQEDLVSFSPLELFHSARTLTGCVAGGGDPRADYPRLVEWAASGRLVTDGLITHRAGLAGLGDAFARMREASGGRTVIRPRATPEPGAG